MSKRKNSHRNPTSTQTKTLIEQVKALIEVEDYKSAEPLCNQMLANNTKEYDVYILCANVAFNRKRYGNAIKYFDSALKLQPNNPKTILDKAICHILKGEFQVAINIIESQLEGRQLDNKTLAEIYRYKAHAKHQIGLHEEGEALYDKALEYNDKDREIYYYRIHDNQFRSSQYNNILRYAKKIELLTTDDNLNYIMAINRTLMYMCDWQNRQQEFNKLKDAILYHNVYEGAFTLIGLSDDPALSLQINKQFAQSKFEYVEAFPLAIRPQNKRIKIAYLSADLHGHATAFLLAEIFELHDDFTFEVYAYSYGPNIQDKMRERITQSVEHFYEVSGWTDYQIAEHIYQQNIDIAIDLKGYTTNQRLGIFALRPAPIQVSFLGYPATTGAEFIDYVIGDKWVTPPEIEPFFTEKIVRMPNSYQPNDRHRQINPITPSRQELGIPQNAFVFCCFNNNYKINPEIFNIWCNLLNQVPNSILWLLEDNIYAKQNLIKEAKIRGIEENRLVFAKRLPLDEHLARHRQADLFLDTLPCNAHTTASDALWAGLPVLTCPGQSFASRVGASLVSAVGLPQMIVNNLQEYEQKALFLSTHPEELNKIKQKLINQVKDSPLFDTISYCADLESAYERMYQIYRLGKEPQSFNVEDL